MFVRKHRKREVDQKDQCNRGVQEVRQESGFETADSSVNDNYNTKLVSFTTLYSRSAV